MSTTKPLPCPECGKPAEFVAITPEPDENEYYYDVHLCYPCWHYFEDKTTPLIYDYEMEELVEVKDPLPPAMTRAQMEAAGQLRLFDV